MYELRQLLVLAGATFIQYIFYAFSKHNNQGECLYMRGEVADCIDTLLLQIHGSASIKASKV
jgi:hypothetical protein